MDIADTWYTVTLKLDPVSLSNFSMVCKLFNFCAATGISQLLSKNYLSKLDKSYLKSLARFLQANNNCNELEIQGKEFAIVINSDHKLFIQSIIDWLSPNRDTLICYEYNIPISFVLLLISYLGDNIHILVTNWSLGPHIDDDYDVTISRMDDGIMSIKHEGTLLAETDSIDFISTESVIRKLFFYSLYYGIQIRETTF